MHAIIDLGSNTVRLNVYQVIDQKISLVFSKKEFVSLASYVNDYQQLTEEGIQAALGIIKHYVKTLENLNIKQGYLIATASLRQVSNRLSVIEKIRKVVPFEVELLTEEQEALADLEGVMMDTKFDQGLVVDIGGGSTELVALEKQEVIFAKAIKMGSLSAYVQYVNKILPKEKELKKIKKAVENALEKLSLPPFKPKTLYGVGGTIRAARKLAIGVFNLPSDHRELSLTIIQDLIQFLLKKDKVAYLKTIQIIPERLHTILPGLKILETIVKEFGKPLVVISDYGVREGYLLQKLSLVKARAVRALPVTPTQGKVTQRNESKTKRSSGKQ
jgi:exopolyphosphatase/guanosine-5'-triphosphate,3'-diphosphate pyrophosphatase